MKKQILGVLTPHEYPAKYVSEGTREGASGNFTLYNFHQLEM